MTQRSLHQPRSGDDSRRHQPVPVEAKVCTGRDCTRWLQTTLTNIVRAGCSGRGRTQPAPTRPLVPNSGAGGARHRPGSTHAAQPQQGHSSGIGRLAVGDGGGVIDLVHSQSSAGTSTGRGSSRGRTAASAAPFDADDVLADLDGLSDDDFDFDFASPRASRPAPKQRATSNQTRPPRAAGKPAIGKRRTPSRKQGRRAMDAFAYGS